MRDNCESALAELDATLAEVKRDRDEEWTRLKVALAAMTKERDRLKTELHDLGKQYDAEFRARVVAEAKLGAVEAVLESPDPCDEWAERGKDTDYTYEDGAIVEATRWRERLQQALATTGPSLRQRVEKVLAQWRGQTWVYTRGEVIRRTCIEELEAALKPDPPAKTGR